MNSLTKTGIAALLICLALVAIQLFSFTDKESNVGDESFQKHFTSNYKIFALTLPDELEFASEPVPLHLMDVREKLDRELLINTYWQSQSLLFHKRANRYFPVIEPILAKHGVPDDFKYLCLVESGFTNVVSPAGATGFWQFMKNTGLQYGLEIEGEIDERYHLEKSTVAACKYLKEAYRKYGSWSMAAASYNLGINGLEKQVARQKVDNYFDLLLVEETARYLFRVLAVKEIMTKPAEYGFHFREKDLYPPYRTYIVKVDTPITDLATFALDNDINYKILKTLNPWLRDNFLLNKTGKSYEIKLPEKGFEDLIPFDANFEVTDTLMVDTIAD
jgi:hypothetical protein